MRIMFKHKVSNGLGPLLEVGHLDIAKDLYKELERTYTQLEGEIPFVKRPGGRKLFFSKKALESWLLESK